MTFVVEMEGVVCIQHCRYIESECKMALMSNFPMLLFRHHCFHSPPHASCALQMWPLNSPLFTLPHSQEVIILEKGFLPERGVLILCGLILFLLYCSIKWLSYQVKNRLISMHYSVPLRTFWRTEKCAFPFLRVLLAHGPQLSALF